jgi:exosortase
MNTSTRTLALRAHWPAWLLAAGLYAPIFRELYFSRWELIDYSHAYFILPVALWIVWQRRRTLRNLAAGSHSAASAIAGLTAMTVGLLMFTFGWRLDYLFVTTLSLIPVLWGMAAYLYGGALARAITFPMLFLLFLVPPPLGVLDQVTLPMRYATSHTAETLLRMLDYPIARSGLLLTIGGKEIFMGAPCSGLRSLITMLALAAAYVCTVKGGVGKRVMLISSAIPFALAGNLARVITLCLIAFYAGQEAAEGFFHYFSGGVIFLIMIGCLMGLETVLERLQGPAEEA